MELRERLLSICLPERVVRLERLGPLTLRALTFAEFQRLVEHHAASTPLEQACAMLLASIVDPATGQAVFSADDREFFERLTREELTALIVAVNELNGLAQAGVEDVAKN